MENIIRAYNAAEDEIIRKLSEWYKFDGKEAKKRLHESNEPSIPLPFCGEIKSDWCLGMKKNHNLYSQCTGKRMNDRLCNKCQKEEDKLGKVKEGYIEERLSCNLMDYKDVQNYGNVLEKLNITKEKAMEEAARFNIVIPEEQYEVKKKVTQRGRPNNSKQPKEVVLNNKEEEKKKEEKTNNCLGEGGQGDVNPPKKRGRPKKEQKKVVNNCGEELIAALVNEAQKKETEDVFETAKKAKQEAAKKAKQEQEKQIEEAKKAQAKQEEKKKLEEQAKQEEKKKQEEELKQEQAKKIVEDELCEEEVDEEESEQEDNKADECDEEEITVSKFEFNGIKYLKSSDNILYDPISQDPVGIWNEDDECIDEIEEDDDE